MNYTLRVPIFILSFFLLITTSQTQVIVAMEDFDGGALNLTSTTNVLDYGAGGGSSGDVFGRVDGQSGGTGMPFDVADDSAADVSGAITGSAFPSDVLGIAGQNTSAFFAMNDMDGSDGPGLMDATWTFDISSAGVLTSIQIDLAAMGDFEAGSMDGFKIEARVDAGTYHTIFEVITDESAMKTYRAFDDGDVFSLVDPLELFIDGSSTAVGYLDKSNSTTGEFDTYISTFMAGMSGATLDIRVSWSGTPSGGEPMGIDNITVYGVSIGNMIAMEDFDGGALNLSMTSNVFDYGSGGGSLGDVFGRVEGGVTGMPFDVGDDSQADVSGGGILPGDGLGIAGQNTSAFFAMNDADGVSLNNAVWTFDISSASYITTIQIDLAALGDFEASSSDGFLIEAQIDGSGYQTLFEAITDESAFKNYRPLDGGSVFSDDDPLQLFIDGNPTAVGFLDKSDPTTGDFDSYISTLFTGMAGSSLDIRVSWSGTPSGSEPMGIDNIIVKGALSVFISDIQGSGSNSPLPNGTLVTVTATVIGDFQDSGMGANGNLGGFFLQEEDADADADPLTSEGIFVFDGFSPSIDVAVGDQVSITAEVSEFFGLTQLWNITELAILSSGNPLPTTTLVTFPTAGVITVSPGEYEPNLEPFEGMLIDISNTMTVTELFNLDRLGQMLLTEGDRLYQYTFNNMPDATGYDMHLQDIARRTIILDDGMTIQNPDPIIYPDGMLGTDDEMRMGDQVSSLNGVLTYQFGEYLLEPTTNAPIFTNSNPRPVNPPDVGGTLKVASLNVLNFFTTIDDGSDNCGPGLDLSCRGADDVVEYNRQLEKLVTTLAGLDADILGLVELENNVNASPADDGTDPVLGELISALNTVVGAGTYNFVDAGIIGSDVIKVGIIYKPSVVIPASGTNFAIISDGDLASLGFASYAPLFGGLSTNRNSLAATFKQVSDGEKITVVVNHLKSKSNINSVCPGPNCDNLDGAGAHNQTRTRALEVINAWLQTDPTGSGDPDFLLLGDFNAYSQEDPIKYLESNGYSEMIKMMTNDPNAYSYVFDGQAGMLDYAFASSSLVDQVIDAAEWHINADEADAIDYNLLLGRDPAIFNGLTGARSSDHDPVIVGLVLEMRPIPTLSQWGRILLGLILLIMGILAYQQSNGLPIVDD